MNMQIERDVTGSSRSLHRAHFSTITCPSLLVTDNFTEFWKRGFKAMNPNMSGHRKSSYVGPSELGGRHVTQSSTSRRHQARRVAPFPPWLLSRWGQMTPHPPPPTTTTTTTTTSTTRRTGRTETALRPQICLVPIQKSIMWEQARLLHFYDFWLQGSYISV